ncbi:MAG TPA: DUF5131 family protein [Phycisphaerae bacterium]|nr:DUF5131 family protein [Phycisphaerae bacterium]
MNREGPDKIGYLDWTWSPVVGCTNGCPWCWARRQAKRQKHNCRKCYDFIPHLHPERLDEPLRKRKPSVIGVAFMGDLFDPTLPDEDRDRVFAVMALANRHTFCILTKQPERMQVYLNNKDRLLDGIWGAFADNHVGPTISTADDVRKWCKKKGMPERERDRRMGIIQDAGGFWFGRPDLTSAAFWPLPNVVLGVSVEDQESADRLIPELMACPVAKRIVSIEPMRGVVDVSPWLKPQASGPRERGLAKADLKPALSGVILGGQTGPVKEGSLRCGEYAVQMDPDWVRQVRDQCQAAGVPFYFKSWGALVPADQARWDGKGRMLDGRTHDEVPWTAGLRPEA